MGLLVGLVGAVAPLAAPGESAPDRQGGGAVAKRFYRGDGLPAFEKGYKAWELGHWEEAADLMTKALEEEADQPEAQVRVRSNWYTPYVPTFYLTLARCKLAKCGEAGQDTDKILGLIKNAPYLRKPHQSACDKGCPPGTTSRR